MGYIWDIPQYIECMSTLERRVKSGDINSPSLLPAAPPPPQSMLHAALTALPSLTLVRRSSQSTAHDKGNGNAGGVVMLHRYLLEPWLMADVSSSNLPYSCCTVHGSQSMSRMLACWASER